MSIKGAILGDIIGSKWEFSGCPNPYTCELLSDDNFFTDDTIMSVATKIALDTNWTFDEVYHIVGENYLDYPYAGWGTNFRNWILENGYHYDSYGNGSAMRISYIGSYASSESECIELATESAKTSHNTDIGIKGAVFVALAVYRLTHNQLTKQGLLEMMEQEYPQYSGKSLEWFRENHIWTCNCEKCVPLAVRCIYESDSFEQCMRNILSVFCDTDTIGAIAGGMAGVLFGIPYELSNQLPNYLDDFLWYFVKGED